jgi:two-component system sensor histidine kinase and response regulator WspE
MNQRGSEELSGASMFELFRAEAENQTAILTAGLLELERTPATPQAFEMLMRAAHSLKGAARIVNLQAAVRVAHALEDSFVAAQRGELRLSRAEMDVLFRGVDLLGQLARRSEAGLAGWESDNAAGIKLFLSSLAELMAPLQAAAKSPRKPVRPQSDTPTGAASVSMAKVPDDVSKVSAEGLPVADSWTKPGLTVQPDGPTPVLVFRKQENTERVLRLTAENLNRLLALAGESLVESRWLRPFADSLERLKRQHMDLTRQLEFLRSAIENDHQEGARTSVNDLLHRVGGCQKFLADRMQELDMFDRRSAHLSQRLYLEVLRTRMRPFSDGVRRFPRMVRDLARSLGKEIKLEIYGENTQVDRDILERLETPVAHLLRNAVDHGCEPVETRRRVGKSAECTIGLEARHSAGVLLVTVTDDGGGVDPERVRRAVVEKHLATAAVAEKLTESELLEFLFLPGFTLKETVTEISGRGFGLDVVQNMVKTVRGSIRLQNQPGLGLRVQLQLPLTLSVLRALLVEVAGEPYAVPLSQITRALKVPRQEVETLEGRPHFRFGDQQVGLLTAHQVLECGEPEPSSGDLPVVILGDRNNRYGVVVDRFLGERELVVQPLDPRLGKLRDISAAALMEDGAPVLILDIEDLVRSIEKLVVEGMVNVQRHRLDLPPVVSKRILIADDSLTVRELERKLLAARGYHTEVAVDGMEAWNAVRAERFDLVITDIDMPRLDGMELAALIKKDPRLKSIPVLIISYKDREADRLRGLEAGADCYLTKGSFDDNSLLQAVVDLIGEPENLYSAGAAPEGVP